MKTNKIIKWINSRIRFYKKCSKNIAELKNKGKNPTEIKNRQYLVAYNDAISKIEAFEQFKKYIKK